MYDEFRLQSWQTAVMPRFGVCQPLHCARSLGRVFTRQFLLLGRSVGGQIGYKNRNRSEFGCLISFFYYYYYYHYYYRVIGHEYVYPHLLLVGSGNGATGVHYM